MQPAVPVLPKCFDCLGSLPYLTSERGAVPAARLSVQVTLSGLLYFIEIQESFHIFWPKPQATELIIYNLPHATLTSLTITTPQGKLDSDTLKMTGQIPQPEEGPTELKIALETLRINDSVDLTLSWAGILTPKERFLTLSFPLKALPQADDIAPDQSTLPAVHPDNHLDHVQSLQLKHNKAPIPVQLIIIVEPGGIPYRNFQTCITHLTWEEPYSGRFIIRPTAKLNSLPSSLCITAEVDTRSKVMACAHGGEAADGEALVCGTLMPPSPTNDLERSSPSSPILFNLAIDACEPLEPPPLDAPKLIPGNPTQLFCRMNSVPDEITITGIADSKLHSVTIPVIKHPYPRLSALWEAASQAKPEQHSEPDTPVSPLQEPMPTQDIPSVRPDSSPADTQTLHPSEPPTVDSLFGEPRLQTVETELTQPEDKTSLVADTQASAESTLPPQGSNDSIITSFEQDPLLQDEQLLYGSSETDSAAFDLFATPDDNEDNDIFLLEGADSSENANLGVSDDLFEATSDDDLFAHSDSVPDDGEQQESTPTSPSQSPISSQKPSPVSPKPTSDHRPPSDDLFTDFWGGIPSKPDHSVQSQPAPNHTEQKSTLSSTSSQHQPVLTADQPPKTHPAITSTALPTSATASTDSNPTPISAYPRQPSPSSPTPKKRKPSRHERLVQGLTALDDDRLQKIVNDFDPRDLLLALENIPQSLLERVHNLLEESKARTFSYLQQSAPLTATPAAREKAMGKLLRLIRNYSRP